METVVSVDSKSEDLLQSSTPVTAEAFRSAMGHFLTGVTIVTTRCNAGIPYGLTVSSFNSVSLDPPLILWSLDLGNDRATLFRESAGFTVNVLPAGCQELIRTFAAPDAERFADTAWHWGAFGQPVLKDAIASFECRLWAEYPGGDHAIFVGEVMDIATRDGEAAAYFKGRLGTYPS
ncbi:MAG: nitrilotriacetate monooxygenase [SAR116 cluster bacterium]|nr:nitrilotriacetate monooxygenase [SAR116 cluster bacterium]RPG96283.1 MAG: flavin reductase [Candidatus Puniceispirillum sp. TMED176]